MEALRKLDFSDITYNMINPVFWTVTEPSLVIINVCLPAHHAPSHEADQVILLVRQSLHPKLTYRKTSSPHSRTCPENYPTTFTCNAFTDDPRKLAFVSILDEAPRRCRGCKLKEVV